MTRHRDAVYRMARGATGDADAALDVTQEAFVAAFAALPAALREVLLLRGVEQMSQAETAAVLGIGEKAVETRLYRARRRLAETMRESAPPRV